MIRLFLAVLFMAGAAHADPVSLTAAVVGAAISSSAGVAAFFGSAFLAQVAGFVVSTAISQIGGRAFSKKPKVPDFSPESRAVTVRSSVESHKVIYGQAKVSGPLVFVKTVDFGVNNLGARNGVDGGNGFLHMVIALAGHEIEEISTIYLNDKACTLDGDGFVQEEPYYYQDGSGLKFVRVKKHLGADDQEADADLVNECGLTNDHRLQGIAYLYVRMQWNPNVFPQGIPNISCVVKGKKLYDPRDVGHDIDDPSTWEWSDNAALCIRDYLASDYGFSCDADEINDTYVIAAANVCDEDVTLADASTQNRYTCNGVVDTATAPLDNLNSLVSSLAGAVTYVQGQFRIHAGAYDTTSGAITADMLAAPIKAELRTPRKELFNAIKGTYVDPDKEWQQTDFPFVTNSTYEEQDGGERIYKDIDLPFTNHPEAAQRIGKLLLEKARQGIKVELTLNHSALKYTVFDTVTFSDEQFGWSDKVFRILKVGTTGTGPISMVLQEESSASYDWNSGEASTTDAAPDTNLPDPFTVLPPPSLQVSESTYITRSGDGVKAMATLTWVASPDAFLREYQAEYRLRPSGDWNILHKTTVTTQNIEDITPGEYDFRVKALNTLGVASPYSTTSAQIAGLLAPPTAPQNLTISTIGGLAVLRWDISPDLDVRIGGKVVFRHSPTATDGWVQSTTIGNAVPGGSTVAVLPLKPGIYLAKALDSSAIESTSASSVTTDQATALTYADIDSIAEHPTFSGTMTSCETDGLTLSIAGAGLLDDITDFDAVSDLASFGGVSPSGTYTFSAGIDLGAVGSVRLTSHLQAQVVNVLDMIDDRSENIDDWTNFDGATAASADASVWVRATDDDPSGAPIWSAWQRLDSAEFRNRAFGFKCELSSQDPAYNIELSELSVTAAEVV